MVALLVLGGMGIWILVDRFVGRAMQKQAPRQENYEADANIPMLQARLAGLEAEMQAVQNELTTQAMQSLQQANRASLLQSTYPQLVARQAELEKLTALPPEIVSGYVTAVVDATTDRSLVDTLEGELLALMSEKYVLSTTLTTRVSDPAETIQAQTRLGLVDSQIEAVQSELVKQKMELLRQQAKVEASKSLFPELATLFITTTQTTNQSPIQVIGVYLDLMTKQQETQALALSYKARLAEIEQNVAQNTQELEAARRRAQQDFLAAGQVIEDRRRWLTLAWSVAAVAAFLLIALPALFLLNREILKYANPLAVIGSAAAIIAILLAYQAFEMIGAVIVSLLVVVILLLLIRRSAPSSTVVQSKEQVGNERTEL